MTRCRTCGQPLPSLRGRIYHRACQPSRQMSRVAALEAQQGRSARSVRGDMPAAWIEARIARACAAIQARRKAA
jgi:hypothetical protein